MTVEIAPVAYRLRDGAAAVGRSVDHLRRAIAAGELRAKKDAGGYLIGARELREWFDRLPDA